MKEVAKMLPHHKGNIDKMKITKLETRTQGYPLSVAEINNLLHIIIFFCWKIKQWSRMINGHGNIQIKGYFAVSQSQESDYKMLLK